MESQEILRYLPHRYPFLLVDRIVDMEPGKRAVGMKNVTINEPFFQGHFPDYPVMPGVLIVEAMAQVIGCCILSQEAYRGHIGFFTGIDGMRFRRQVKPGDTLRMEVELLRMRGGMAKAKGTAWVEDEIAAEGEILFAIGPKQGEI